jgi:hypothetical protein
MAEDLSPAGIIRKMLTAGYQVVAKNVKSPVGRVPQGSTVLTDHNGKRAVWVNGDVYQKSEYRQSTSRINWAGMPGKKKGSGR